jgi:RsiW-degrading membrane proteinase PrsW (M82 family)
MSFFIASITPVIIFLFLIYNKDSIKEPFGLLMKCFFGGILSIIITLILDRFLAPIGKGFTSPLGSAFFDAFLQAGFPEEFSKLIILYWLIWRRKEFDQHFDGIIYAVFVSMGFALVENIMYVYEGGMSVALLRAVLAVPGHGFFAVAMGYYFSLAKFHNGPKKGEFILKCFMVPAILHSLYDLGLIYASKKANDPLLVILLMILSTVVVIMFWKRGLKKIALHHQKDTAEIVVDLKS